MRTRMRPRLRLALTLALSLTAGCGGTIGAGGDGQTDSAAGAWVLVEGAVGSEPVPVLEGHEQTLEIDRERWSGTAACNRYDATVALEDGHVALDELSVTEMGCMPEEVMAAEALYLEALGAIDRLGQPHPDALILEGGDARLEYERRPDGEGPDDPEDDVDPDTPVTDEPMPEPDGS